jgi:hypothetical protein
MEFGASKYDDGNWRKGGKPDSEYLDSMMRHLTSWLEGEVYDTDSGCGHLGHAIWNLLALHELNHPDEIMDDEVFKKQCEHWKAEKEAERYEDVDPVEGPSKVPEPLGVLYDNGKPFLDHLGGNATLAASSASDEEKTDITQQTVSVIGNALRREVGRDNKPPDVDFDANNVEITAFNKIVMASLTYGASAMEWEKALKKIKDNDSFLDLEKKYNQALLERSKPVGEERNDVEDLDTSVEFCTPVQESKMVDKIKLPDTKKDMANSVDLFVPAEYCTDDEVLQENIVIAEIKPAQWQLDELKGNQQECCGGNCGGRCERGCRGDECTFKSPSFKYFSADYFQQLEEGHDDGDCTCKPITFEIKDMDKSKSFQMLEKEYIYPAMLKMAKDNDCEWLKAYDDYFQHLAEEYGE